MRKTLFELLKIVIRQRTIISILSLLVVAIIRELTALSQSEELRRFYDETYAQNSDEYVRSAISLLRAVTLGGSYLNLTILIVLLISFICLKVFEDKLQTLNPAFILDQKKTVMSKAIKQIREREEMEDADFFLMLRYVQESSLRNDLHTYHDFVRGRGNIYELERIITDRNLIPRLKEIRDE
jgi:hypothetical protein